MQIGFCRCAQSPKHQFPTEPGRVEEKLGSVQHDPGGITKITPCLHIELLYEWRVICPQGGGHAGD
jgi:hypothetical protein